MKMFVVAALAALALPAAALAQTAPATPRAQTPPAGGTAAATLPNTFDAPAEAAPARPAAPAADTTPSTPASIAAAEAALKKTIAAAQSGTMNYADMSPSLAEQVRAQSATVTPLIQGFGALKTVEHVGRENGAELFMVEFEKQATQWIVGLDQGGKIVALLFKPAEDGAEPAA